MDSKSNCYQNRGHIDSINALPHFHCFSLLSIPVVCHV
jgi:hypothetical protein